jgi:hypothetical protein
MQLVRVRSAPTEEVRATVTGCARADRRLPARHSGNCRTLVQALDGSLRLDNRVVGGRVVGLDAVVRLPLDT